MLGISALSSYYGGYNTYNSYRAGLQQSQAAQAGGVLAPKRASSPETPVQPVAPVRAVSGEEARPIQLGPVLREGADPAEMAVRMRIQPYREPSGAEAGAAEGAEEMKGEAAGVASAQEAIEEGKCETCEKRKYQDGSDDMGVSFQTPTRVDPDMAAAAVRGHENEHVVREQAKAQREDRKVVSQSVTLHSAICPECGKTYVSGGTTRTTTKADTEQMDNAAQAQKEAQERKPFSVWG